MDSSFDAQLFGNYTRMQYLTAIAIFMKFAFFNDVITFSGIWWGMSKAYDWMVHFVLLFF